MKKILSIAALFTFVSLSSALAQSDSLIVSSFPVSNDGSPLECLGHVLSNPEAPRYNGDAPRVELRGIRLPYRTIIDPTDEGKADETKNPLLDVTSIGNACTADGLFCLEIKPDFLTNYYAYDPQADQTGKYWGFFFRVYDQSTVEASHYYADSSIFGYSSENQVHKTSGKVTFKSKSLGAFPGTSPDSDGDGLSDVDEMNRTHTDPFDADSDGDGIDDGVEDAYGLDPMNPLIVRLFSEPVEGVASDSPEGKDWYASWHVSTNPKVHYTLQFVPDLMDPADGTPTHPAETQRVTAQSDKSEFRSLSDTNWSEIVNDWVRTNSIGFMRVLMSIDTNSVSSGE